MMKKQYTNLLRSTMILALGLLVSISASAGAKYMECGKSYWYPASQQNQYSNSNYNWGTHTQANFAYDGGDQLFYFDVVGTKDVTIKMNGLRGDLDMFLFKNYNEWGHHRFTDCQGTSINGNYDDEEIVMNGASGRYYLVVDAYRWGVSSGYDIEITCKDKPAPPVTPVTAVCAQLPTLRCGDHKVIGGYSNSNWVNTTDMMDTHPECSTGGYGWNTKDYSGPENIFKLSSYYGSLSDVTIDVHELDYNTDVDVFVYTHCEMWKNAWGEWETKFSGLVNKCDNYGNSHNWSQNTNKSVHLGNVGYHTELYVVIEGKSSDWGRTIGKYEISISCGEICDQDMPTIECNSKVQGKTSGRKNMASYYQESAYSSSAGNWGPEMTYEINIEQEMDLELDLHIYSNADLNMYLMNACEPDRCVASSVTYGKGQHESLKQRMRPGRYYVVIEGYHGDHGNYELEVSGCRCANAQELYCDRPISASTHNATNRISSIQNDCFSSYGGVWLKGKDMTYSFVAPEAGTYEFTLTGLSKDLDLFLMSDCEDENTCLGYSTKTSDRDELIRIDLRKNEEIYAHVDTRSTNVVSGYKIEVVCNPEPEPDPDPTPDPDPVDPDPEPDPDPDPTEPSGECYSFQMAGNVIKLDLSDADLTTCDSAEITVMVMPLDDSGNPIMTEIVVVDVVGDVASFDPGINEAGTDYRVCYEESCNGVIKSCCQEFTYEEVIMLTCGDSFEGTTVGASSNYDSGDISECYSSSSSFSGPDQLIPFTKNRGTTVAITMFQSSANLSLFVLDADHNVVSSECKGSNFNTTKDITNTNAVGEFWSDSADPLPAGTYFMLIEGYAKQIESDFTLDIACGLDCSVADSIALGDNLSDEASADGLSNNSAYHIEESLKVGYTGAERVYAITLDSTMKVDIALGNMIGDDVDFDLFVLSDACDAYSVIGQSITEGDSEEGLTLSLDAGTYYIVVDGWRGSAGTFDLAVTANTSGDLTGVLAGTRSVNSDVISHSAYPNPFARDLYIDIAVGVASSATVEMMSIDGKRLSNTSVQLVEGANRIKIAGENLGVASGVMYYRINTGTDIIQGKVMKMN